MSGWQQWLPGGRHEDPPPRCENAEEFRYPCTIPGLGSEAQVTCGGVRREELGACDAAVPTEAGPVFRGEVIDVDGRCGGFNMQWPGPPGCGGQRRRQKGRERC